MGNIKDTLEEAQKYGWIVRGEKTDVPKHYCSKYCLAQAEDENMLSKLKESNPQILGEITPKIEIIKINLVK